MERFLNSFPSNKIYKKLNEKEDSKKCSEKCKILNVQFSNNPKIYELCCILGKNLRDISTIVDNTENNIERCRYFNFWKNDQINQIYDSNKTYNINNIRTRFFSISSIISTQLSKEECYYIYRKDISMELWKKWKNLFDYIRNKHEMEKIIDKNNELCKIYKSYHAYITSIYKDYQKECCKGFEGKCPHFLEFNEWCDEKDILNKLECNDSEVVSPNTLGHRIDNVAQQEEADSVVEIQGKGDGFLETGTTGSPRPEERQERHSSGQQEETVAGRLNDNSNMVSGPIDEASESMLPKNTGTIGATFAGSSLFLLMMYKYTPMGSWINTKILGRNKLIDNMNKNNYELLLNDVGNLESSISDPMYHIRYNSATNH
ncbi:hypothetical protein PVMG_05535 [Plasmodium vivax Mauritania I]|uniref:Vir protein n=1 Tax=Plasmodium vivax Mauritania I TaxID=1035515 RepID=A0A0J9TI53_PLAVI|nr:hypothetical protein PVMG_05535 [Plasmodium vivax Mauritania I]